MTIQDILSRFQNLTIATIFLVSQLIATALITIPAQTKAETGITKIGQIGGNDSLLDSPQDIALDSVNNIYVVDRDNNQVQKFNSDGVYQSQFGSGGTGDGEFSSPQSIAIDSSGNIYVTDSNNNRIQKFNSDGVYQSQFGSLGSGDGQFNIPFGITVDSSDNVYVVDSNNNRIQKFNSDGVYQSQFGSLGSGDGQFNNPQSIAIDSSDNMYVTDGNNSRIQKFDSTGIYEFQFGSYGTGDGQFDGPYGIAIDAVGNILVADGENDRIQKFDSTGNFIEKWGANGGDGTMGDGDGEFYYPRGIAIDSVGNIFIVDAENDRIQKLSSSGEFISLFPPTPELMISYGKAGIDSDNNVYIPTLSFIPGGGDMRVFSPSGTKLSSWLQEDDSFLGSSVVRGSAVYTVIFRKDNTGKIVKTTLQGLPIAEWDVPGIGMGLDIDNAGNVYYLDAVGSKVYKYSSTGELLSQFGEAGTNEGQINNTAGEESSIFMRLAIDNNDNIYISDLLTNESVATGRIQKFTSSGTFLKSLQNDPDYIFAGLSFSPEGKLYTMNINFNEDSTIQKFNNNLELLSEYIPEAPLASYSGPTAGANGLLYINNVYSYGIDILCDHDVSTDGCQSTGGGDNGGSGLTDINGDGIPDSTQSNVTALSAPGTNKPVGLEVSADCTLTDTTIAPEANQTVADPAYTYPSGLVSFTADCGTPGYTTTVQLYYYDTPKNNLTLRKHNPTTNAYFNLTGQYGATLQQTTLNNRTVTIASYQITDGSDLDIDNQTNGSIQDPVGIAEQTTGSADTGLPRYWLLNVK